MKVKFLDLRAQYGRISESVEAAVRRVMESGDYILGGNVSALEAEIAAYCGSSYCAGVASGTDALLLALKACGVSRGDSVITSPFTFTASVEAVIRAGAEPVLCDVEPDTFNMDASKIEEALRKNTKALLPVHLYGHPADMDEVLRIAGRKGLRVIEDSAQSFGALYRGRPAGSMGDAGAFSFFPSKTLGACGDAGMVSTGDREIYEKIKLLRAHGLENGECMESGYNSRLDEVQAAVLRVKLKHVGEWLEERRRAARVYSALLSGAPVGIPAVMDYAGHSFNYYVIKCPRRDELRRELSSLGIDTGVYYAPPAHLHRAFRNLGYGEGDFPQAEKLSREVLALPIYPEITPEEQEYVAGGIKSFYGGGRA